MLPHINMNKFPDNSCVYNCDLIILPVIIFITTTIIIMTIIIISIIAIIVIVMYGILG